MTESIAIGYHGLIRGFRFPEVRQSHIDLLIKPLREQGYTVDIYVHTFDKEYDDSIMCVEPKQIVKENDKETEAYVMQYAKPYVFPHYFLNEHKINYFKDMYTRQKCYEMIQQAGIAYRWVLMINPGNLITSPIDDLRSLKGEIYIPDFSHHHGYNGRCAIGTMKAMKVYASVFDTLVKHQRPPLYLSCPQHDIFNAKGQVNLHPESSIKHILNLGGYHPKEEGHLLKSFVFERIRSDGTRKPNN